VALSALFVLLLDLHQKCGLHKPETAPGQGSQAGRSSGREPRVTQTLPYTLSSAFPPCQKHREVAIGPRLEVDGKAA
jgi:hypothetical protein